MRRTQIQVGQEYACWHGALNNPRYVTRVVPLSTDNWAWVQGTAVPVSTGRYLPIARVQGGNDFESGSNVQWVPDLIEPGMLKMPWPEFKTMADGVIAKQAQEEVERKRYLDRVEYGCKILKGLVYDFLVDEGIWDDEVDGFARTIDVTIFRRRRPKGAGPEWWHEAGKKIEEFYLKLAEDYELIEEVPYD